MLKLISGGRPSPDRQVLAERDLSSLSLLSVELVIPKSMNLKYEPSSELSEMGTVYHVSRACGRKPRPESGPDCLMCAEFARRPDAKGETPMLKLISGGRPSPERQVPAERNLQLDSGLDCLMCAESGPDCLICAEAKARIWP